MKRNISLSITLLSFCILVLMGIKFLACKKAAQTSNGIVSVPSETWDQSLQLQLNYGLVTGYPLSVGEYWPSHYYEITGSTNGVFYGIHFYFARRPANDVYCTASTDGTYDTTSRIGMVFKDVNAGILFYPDNTYPVYLKMINGLIHVYACSIVFKNNATSNIYNLNPTEISI